MSAWQPIETAPRNDDRVLVLGGTWIRGNKQRICTKPFRAWLFGTRLNGSSVTMKDQDPWFTDQSSGWKSRRPDSGISAMKCIGLVLLCSLALLAFSARAETISIEPGQWKVTAKTAINGAAQPPKVTMSCLSAEQAGDVTKGLGPSMGTVNSTCAPTEFQIKVGQMKWRLGSVARGRSISICSATTPSTACRITIATRA